MIKITGSALTKFNRRKDGSSFRDWTIEAFEKALALSTVDPADIDQLVIASESDFFTLQLNPASVLADDLGLRGCATVRVEGGGASGQLAVHAGVDAIRAGSAKHVAVIGADPSASQLQGDAIRELYGFSFDALSDGLNGITATALYALSIQQFMPEHRITSRHFDIVTQQNRKNACSNPAAHLPLRHSLQDIQESPLIASPYRRLHCSPLSDGAAAVILSASNAVPRARRLAPTIAGKGAASDRMHLGARTNGGIFAAKTRAMSRACCEAGINPKDVTLAEVYDAYAGAQLQALHALGLSEQVSCDLEAGHFQPDGRCPTNLSGGLIGQGAPVGAVGVAQTANCALFLEGLNNSALQPQNPPQYAVADTHGGICTTAAVTLLKRTG